MSLICVLFFLLPLGLAAAQKCATADMIHAGRTTQTSPPDLPYERVSVSGRFVIHFASSGEHAVSVTFVDSTEAILEQCWLRQVDQLGYPQPLGSGDGRVHVYLVNLVTTYGYTVPSQLTGTSLEGYMVLDNDFLDPAHRTRGINGLRVTIAHEFFHLIHFAMRLDPAHLYFYEWSSTWMEEKLFPEINDYFHYLPAVFESTELSIRTLNGRREYGMALFPIMVATRWGDDLLRVAFGDFAEMGGDPFLHLLSSISAQTALTEKVIAQQFLVDLLLTGERWVQGFGFPDARWFPEWSLGEGDCGDLQWCGTPGEWGFVGGLLPGGIQGNPRISLTGQGVATAVAVTWQAGVAEWLGEADAGELYGGRGAAGAIRFKPGEGEMRLSVQPTRSGAPESITLRSPYPNPTNGSVRWTVHLDRPGTVMFRVFNLMGREVVRIPADTAPYRVATLSWNGADQFGREASSGVYILHATAGRHTVQSRIVLLR